MASMSASSLMAIFSRSATVAISLEATPALSLLAFNSTFSSSTTDGGAGWRWAGRSISGAKASGSARTRFSSSASSSPRREPPKPFGTDRRRLKASGSVGVCWAISSTPSSFRMRPRGWSRSCAARSRQTATALKAARYLAENFLGFSLFQAFSGLVS